MKATELRIGNWTKWGLGTLQLEIDDMNKQIFDYAEPIPLTEKWGIKFGTPESSMNFSFILHNDIKLWVDKSNENDFQWWFVWKGNHIRVRYVHQLQNLYHALTGNELTISE